MLPKCPHGVYNGTKNGDPTPYCSGCAVPEELPDGAKPVNLDYNPFPYGEQKCPECGSTKFKYVSEWDWSCPACGIDALGN